MTISTSTGIFLNLGFDFTSTYFTTPVAGESTSFN